MISSRILTMQHLLHFGMLAFLPEVLSYVAQLPSAIVEPVQISRLTTSNDSLSMKLNGTSTTLSQEAVPIDFRVDFRLNPRAKAFGRSDFFSTAVLDMASMAILEWNSNVPAKKFEAPYFVLLSFVSSRSGPGLLVKHVVWALEAIFDIIVRVDQYRGSNFEVHLGPTTLGVGSVYSTEKGLAAVNVTDTHVGRIPETTNMDLMAESAPTAYNNTALTTALTSLDHWQGDTSPTQYLPLSHKPATSTDVKAEGQVNLKYWYRADGAVVDDAQVYNASLKLIIRAAEHPSLQDTIWPGFTTYNDRDDFTYTIRPASFDTRADLSYLDSIFALTTIVGMMAKSGGPPGLFAELYGRIKAGGTLIGAFCIDKGDQTGMDLQQLCYRRDSEGADDGDGVATA